MVDPMYGINVTDKFTLVLCKVNEKAKMKIWKWVGQQDRRGSPPLPSHLLAIYAHHGQPFAHLSGPRQLWVLKQLGSYLHSNEKPVKILFRVNAYNNASYIETDCMREIHPTGSRKTSRKERKRGIRLESGKKGLV